MHDPERAKYGYASLLQAMRTFVNISQLDYESLLDYQKRVKQSSEILSSHLGEEFLNKFVEKLPEYRAASDTAEQDDMKAKAFRAFTSYVILKNSDQGKYGSLVQNLQTQFSLGKDEYPKEISKVIDVMSNHRPDNCKDKKKSSNHRNSTQLNNDKDNKKKEETTSITSSDVSFYTEGTCFCCGKKGHISPNCPDKDKIPKNKWKHKIATQHLQANEEETKEESNVSDNQSVNSAWSEVTHNVTGVNGFIIGVTKDATSCNTFQKETNYCGVTITADGISHFSNERKVDDKEEIDLKKCIIIDNGSTINLFGNPDKKIRIKVDNVNKCRK